MTPQRGFVLAPIKFERYLRVADPTDGVVYYELLAVLHHFSEPGEGSHPWAARFDSGVVTGCRGPCAREASPPPFRPNPPTPPPHPAPPHPRALRGALPLCRRLVVVVRRGPRRGAARRAVHGCQRCRQRPVRRAVCRHGRRGGVGGAVGGGRRGRGLALKGKLACGAGLMQEPEPSHAFQPHVACPPAPFRRPLLPAPAYDAPSRRAPTAPRAPPAAAWRRAARRPLRAPAAAAHPRRRRPRCGSLPLRQPRPSSPRGRAPSMLAARVVPLTSDPPPSRRSAAAARAPAAAARALAPRGPMSPAPATR
jgi:hypothetical protein